MPCPTCTPAPAQTLDAFDASVHASLTSALKACRGFPTVKPWLILSGTLGCGKTHLMAGVADMLLRRMDPYTMQSASEVLRAIRATWNMAGDARLRAEAHLQEVLHGPSALLLDDLGAGQGSASEWGQWDDLLCYRYGPPPLPTMATTNLTWELFRQRLPRVASRIAEVGTWVSVMAPDYRQRLSHVR